MDLDYLELENSQLRERVRLLQAGQDRARATVAEFIYYNKLEQSELANKIKFLQDQIVQLTSEVNSYKKKGEDDKLVEFDESGEVRCATLEKLTEYLFSNQNDGHQSTAGIFLLTYRSFTTPSELLELIVEFYNSLTVDMNDPEATKSRLRIGSFLKKWITENFHDFSDPALIDRYNQFVTNIIGQFDNKLGVSLSGAFDNKIKGIQKKYSEWMFSEQAPLPIVPKTAITSIVDIAPQEIARQLTLIDYNFCRQIEPKECLGCAWTKSDKETRSPNLLNMIKRFNRVSRWVSTTIVREESMKKRVKILSHLLSVIQCLRELNNFNAVFQMIGGLENSSVHRITKTFQQIDTKQKKFLEEMVILTNPLKSWSNYRKCIHEVNPPCVPFIGVYQTDLTFIEDGNPTRFANGMINFKKCKLVANVILEIQQYQQKPYNLSNVAVLQDYLSKSIDEAQNFDDKALYEMSLIAEPRVSANTPK